MAEYFLLFQLNNQPSISRAESYASGVFASQITLSVTSLKAPSLRQTKPEFRAPCRACKVKLNLDLLLHVARIVFRSFATKRCLNGGISSVLTKIYLLLALWTLWHSNSIRKDTSRGRTEIDGTA